MDNLFEQMANISKAHGYDILVEQVKELKEENKRMAEALKPFADWPLNYANLHDMVDEVVKAKEALKNRKPYNL